MAVNVKNLETNNRVVTQRSRNFSVIEYVKDMSVAPGNAVNEYFMSKMDVRRRQVVIELNGELGAIVQAGAMQWTTGTVAEIGRAHV